MDDQDRMTLKVRVRELLNKHQGPDDCVLMNEIFVEVTGNHIIPTRRYDQTRIIRSIIVDLREEGCPIGIKAGSNGGYFWARNDEELESTIQTFHKRAISSFKQEAALKRIPFGKLLEQYELELSQQPQLQEAANG